MLTGSLQSKNNKYYAVLNLTVDGKRKPKWIPLGLPVRGNKRQAETLLAQLITEYEAAHSGRGNPSIGEDGLLKREPPNPMKPASSSRTMCRTGSR